MEEFEDSFVHSLRNADAIVLEPEADAGRLRLRVVGRRSKAPWPALRPNSDARVYAGADEFDGVIEQVGEALSQERFTAQNERQRLLDPDFDLGRVEGGVGFNDPPKQ